MKLQRLAGLSVCNGKPVEITGAGSLGSEEGGKPEAGLGSAVKCWC